MHQRTNRLPSFLVLIALALAAPAPPATAVARPGLEPVATVEGITEYRLDNGLRVLLFPDQSKQTITVNITYLVGSRHENYGETGMAHLLEHLVFKGTPRHPDIPGELTRHGARPNGTTSWDRTNYFETFSATDENLEWALDLEADRMVNSFIAKKDLDSEMTVVRNEFEMGENDPGGVLTDRALATSFLWHNYGKSTIGARSDIENVPIERLQAFYKTWYQPDNAVLLVAGKFDVMKALDLIEKKFGIIPRPSRTLPQIYTREPVQDGERAVTVRRVGDTPMAMLTYHVPSGAHADFAALDIAAAVLTDVPSGRLHMALVKSGKAAYSYGFSFQLHDPGIALFAARLQKGQSLDEAAAILIKTVESFGTATPTTEEVDRAKNKVLRDVELALNQSDQIGLMLSEWMALGDWRLFFVHRDRIKDVTPADVQRVAQSYLKPSNRTLGLFVPTEKPDRAIIPDDPSVAEIVAKYRGGAGVAEGEAFEPTVRNIVSRLLLPKSQDGVRVALLPKQTRGDAVNLTLTLHLGNAKSLHGLATVGSLTGGMLMRGTTKHSRQQIQDELTRLKAQAFVSGGPTAASMFINTTRDNLGAVMRLLAEVLREPAFPADEFAELKRERVTSIESQRSEPESIAINEFTRHLNPYPKGDVRYSGTFDEQIADIQAVTLDQVRDFHKKFYGASVAEMAVAGDFDAAEILALVGELFGSWENPTPFVRVEFPYIATVPIDRSFETPDKANAMFLAGCQLEIRDDDPDYPALVLGNYMLGGGFLSSRLAVRIRQQEGLSYGVWSQLSAGSLDRRGQFMAGAIYAPENRDRLEAALRDEIEKVLRDGFTDEEVAQAKSGWLQARQVSRAQDRELIGTLANYLFIDRPYSWVGEFEAKVSALTAQQINDAMRRHIDLKRMAFYKAGDFANKQPVK